MVTAEVYNPEQWNNFFILVGTGAAHTQRGSFLSL